MKLTPGGIGKEHNSYSNLQQIYADYMKFLAWTKCDNLGYDFQDYKKILIDQLMQVYHTIWAAKETLQIDHTTKSQAKSWPTFYFFVVFVDELK